MLDSGPALWPYAAWIRRGGAMSFGGGGQGRVELAGLGARLLAQIIDLFWLLPLSFLLGAVATFVNGGAMSMGGEVMANLIGALVVLLFWVERQATPGKMVLGLRIVDAVTGETPTMGRLTLRYVGYLVAALPLGLGYLWALWDKQKQGWHDKMAGTVVVRDVRG
jgi:uncharacterized RDD family membrane protein YckC